MDFKIPSNLNHRHSTQMKTKPLNPSAKGNADNEKARVIYKQYELFGPGSRAQEPKSIDQQTKFESIAKTIGASAKAEPKLQRGKTQTGE